jgi:hypothetical protein
MNRDASTRRSLFFLRDPAPLADVPDSMRMFLTDSLVVARGDTPLHQTAIQVLRERLQGEGITDANELLESLLSGTPPPLEIVSRLTATDRLELLKARLRRYGLVTMDGYGWTLLGIRVRWNLARIALSSNASLQRLYAACENGIVSPQAFDRFGDDTEINTFLRRFGTIALGGLDEFAVSVRDHFWNHLSNDPSLQEHFRNRPSEADASGEKTAEQQKKIFLSFINHFIPKDRLPEEISTLSPDMAEELIRAGSFTNSFARGEMVAQAKLWGDRHDDGDAEPGGGSNLQDERDGHRRYAETRLQNYVHRRVPEELIKKHLLSSTPKMIVIMGPAGSGKSALMARAARQCRALARVRKGLFIEHFIGATPSSSSLQGTLRRLNVELGLIPANEIERLATDVDDFAEAFALALQKRVFTGCRLRCHRMYI